MKKFSLLLIVAAVFIVVLAVWGPEALARYRDKGILNQIQARESETGTKGYRYSLSGNEKVSILSKCLDSQTQPESEQNALTRMEQEQNQTGTYAFVANKKETLAEGASEGDGIELCNQGIRELKERGILPEEVKEIQEASYQAVLYSAINVPEPRNSVLVWKVSQGTAVQNTARESCLLDAYVDADTGKVYEFYARTEISSWEEMDADGIAAAWAEYMDLEAPEEYENVNPLSENTPYFKKYCFAGTEEDSVVVTIGFYEGINEMYLKISR
ncbi:MAG TPA: hypothetical protein DCZ91_18920 [Lachnospiraceae bacterium]|nr:hypothetical protein [Lachnospiraceae bacterium]